MGSILTRLNNEASTQNIMAAPGLCLHNVAKLLLCPQLIEAGLFEQIKKHV